MNSGQPKPENFHDNDQSIQASSSWLNNLLCLKWKSPCHQTLLPSTIPGTGRHQECWLSGWINGWMAGFEGRIYVWFVLIHLCNTCIAPDIIYIVQGRCSVSINRITLTSLDLRIVLFKMAESLYSTVVSKPDAQSNPFGNEKIHGFYMCLSKKTREMKYCWYIMYRLTNVTFSSQSAVREQCGLRNEGRGLTKLFACGYRLSAYCDLLQFTWACVDSKNSILCSFS